MVHTEGENNRIEIWKDYKDYEGLYQASNLGRLRSLDRWVKSKSGSVRLCKGKILKLYTDKYGYLKVGLSKNNKVKNYLVHRIIAETFLPNTDNLPCVNHKDEDKTNNSVDNLEYCSVLYNNTYGTRLQKVSEKMRNRKEWSKPIDVYDLNMNFIETLPSIEECGRKYNVSTGNVRHCCNGGYKDNKKKNGWHKATRCKNWIFKFHLMLDPKQS